MVFKSLQRQAQERVEKLRAGAQNTDNFAPKKKNVEKCTEFSNPIYMALKNLFTHQDSYYEKIMQTANYWMGNQPIADFPVNASQEYIVEHGDKFNQTILTYQEFSFNFAKEHADMACYQGFYFLSLANFCRNFHPQAFSGMRENFLKELAAKGACYTHTVITPCEKNDQSFTDMLKAYKDGEFAFVLNNGDQSIIMGDNYFGN